MKSSRSRRGVLYRVYSGCQGKYIWARMCQGTNGEHRRQTHSSASFFSSGIATVYAIKAAGLAIGIGIGSSFIVLVSFVWGIFVFREKVHSLFGACVAVACLMLGVLGMSYYSAPPPAADYEGVATGTEIDEEEDGVFVSNENAVAIEAEYEITPQSSQEEDGGAEASNGFVGERSTQKNGAPVVDDLRRKHQVESQRTRSIHSDDTPLSENEPLDSASSPSASTNTRQQSPSSSSPPRKGISDRQLGMMAAAFCGIWGGSIMAPMKWCKADTKGTHYLMSFSIGASIVTLAIWLFRYLFLVVVHGNRWVVAYQALPSFHLRVMWRPAGLSGLLWSIGNFFSLISVNRLGEGVGYPLVQTSILVSGLWGIFYLDEVKGWERVSKWFASSLLTIFGILLLSYEHHEK